MSKVQFGWLIRSVHSWTANLFILSAMIHMFSVFFEKRTENRVRLLDHRDADVFLLLGFGFSGYLLPWNELAFFATKVVQNRRYCSHRRQANAVFLRGGTRWWRNAFSILGFHVACCRGSSQFFWYSFLLVQRQGMSEPLHIKEESSANQCRLPKFYFTRSDFMASCT